MRKLADNNGDVMIDGLTDWKESGVDGWPTFWLNKGKAATMQGDPLHGFRSFV